MVQEHCQCCHRAKMTSIDMGRWCGPTLTLRMWTPIDHIHALGASPGAVGFDLMNFRLVPRAYMDGGGCSIALSSAEDGQFIAFTGAPDIHRSLSQSRPCLAYGLFIGRFNFGADVFHIFMFRRSKWICGNLTRRPGINIRVGTSRLDFWI